MRIALNVAGVDIVKTEENGTFQQICRLSRAEIHQGHHVRVGVDDFGILYLKLYKYK